MKKLGSLLLAFHLLASAAVSAAPVEAASKPELSVRTETKASQGASAGEDVPWTDASIPNLVSKVDGSVNTVKFTHQEWTGTTYQDLDGETQKAADVWEVNRQEASALATASVIYDTQEKAIAGARDYNKAESAYVQFLMGEPQKDWSLTVLQNQDLAQGDAYRDFYQPGYQVKAEDNWKSNLKLPASWTAQGFDFPIYANV